jgi:hypothetical protein
VSRGKKPRTSGSQQKLISRRALQRLCAVILTLAFIAGLVWGIYRLGEEARRGIGPRDRYSVRFADIECEAPPGLDRSTFLSEVRYSSNFPVSFQCLDPDLTPSLSAAFVTHPWVAGVDSVLVESNGKVRVNLRFRTPTLAVKTTDGRRVVDSSAVLLPAATDPAGLPELITPVPEPGSSSGQVWPNDTVKRAVELVETHHPRTLERTATGWRLTMADGKTLVVER